MKSLARTWLVATILIALLAPILANDAPVVAVVKGDLRFPAMNSYLGAADHGPDLASTQTWRGWWLGLPEDSDDWAVMPPIPFGPLMERDTERRLEAPSADHWLGTDTLGRDVLSRLIWGTGTAIQIGLGAMLIALVLGVVLGGMAGYFGGLVDRLVSLVIEIFLCFPALFLVLAAGAWFGNSILAVALVLGLVYWTGVARVVRGEMLSLRERDFVAAARGFGLSTPRILWRHVLPSMRGPLVVQVALSFAAAIIVESTLEFLGLAVGNAESWGALLAEGKDEALRGVWHLWLFPALAVVGTVGSLHSVAEPA